MKYRMGFFFPYLNAPNFSAECMKSIHRRFASIFCMVGIIDQQCSTKWFITIQSPEFFSLGHPFSRPEFLTPGFIASQVVAFLIYLPAIDRRIKMPDPLHNLSCRIQDNGAAEDRMELFCCFTIKGIRNKDLCHIFVAMISVYGIMEGLNFLK